MPPPRRAQMKKKRARLGPLPLIAEESAPASREESGAETRDELPAPRSREERLARRLARQKDFISNTGSAETVRKFHRALASTKAGLAQVEADLATLRRLSGSGRATVPAPAGAAQETPPAPPHPTSEITTPFPLIPIPIPIPPPSVIQQIERAVSGGWIPYYGGPPSGVRVQCIDGAGRPVAEVIPHLYFPWPAPPPPPVRDADGEGGDGYYYYP